MKNHLYPLKFDPLYQYRIWGGRRLENLLPKPLPQDEPIGEAWLLSDRKDHASVVLEGPLKGTTLTQLMEDYRDGIMGKLGDQFEQFPLLLKFLDCNEVLSVQVHPSDNQREYLPEGDMGKTEAWVVLEAAENSKIYAGLKKGATKEALLQAIEDKTLADQLHSFVPKEGDGVFIQSGTVHTVGGAVIFEVQQNSDVTFRLYDWDRVDAKTGKPRELQVEKAIDCIDFEQVEIGPVTPQKSREIPNAETMFDNQHFKLWRIHSDSGLIVGLENEPAILVCTGGKGSMEHAGTTYFLEKGEVMLLPAFIGPLQFRPEGDITLLQIAIPEKKEN